MDQASKKRKAQDQEPKARKRPRKPEDQDPKARKRPRKPEDQEPTKAPKKLRTVSPEDMAMLQKVKIETVPVELKEAFRRAVDKFDLEKFKFTIRPWKSKRLQATFATRQSRVAAYPFGGTAHPVHKDMPEMWALIDIAAPLIGAHSSLIIAHVNYYPKETAAGVSPHQDDEEMLDPNYPIIGIQIGGKAILIVWKGRPNAINGRKGAEVEITEEFMYTFEAGFQQIASHAIARLREEFKGVTRWNVTFRVVYA